MELKLTATITVLVFSICLLHFTVARPRTTERRDEVIPLDQSVVANLPEKTTIKPSVPELQTPGRVPCQFEDPTEESICQEHCIPKGYSYGLCVSYTCSCI